MFGNHDYEENCRRKNYILAQQDQIKRTMSLPTRYDPDLMFGVYKEKLKALEKELSEVEANLREIEAA